MSDTSTVDPAFAQALEDVLQSIGWLSDRTRDAVLSRVLTAHTTALARAREEERHRIWSRVVTMPRRIEPIGGQRTSYIQLDEVLALLESPPPQEGR